jgi:hypothetical protein
MRDHRIADKDFNPYDLGSIARASRELRERGHFGPRYSEPYIPPSPAEGKRIVGPVGESGKGQILSSRGQQNG